MSTPILALQNITKCYSENFTLENISLTLFPGEVHAVVGENGSGKSTVMKVIGGVIKPDSGNILIKGKIMSFSDAYDAKKNGILYIMQENNLFKNLSTAENVFYDRLDEFRGFLGINQYKLFRSCSDLFKELGINIDVRKNISTLGLAQKQLIELAKAYVSHAKIIVFDEPSSAFTDVELEILFKMIQCLKEKGIGIFFISHRLDDILRIADKVSVLNHGKLVGTHLVKDVGKIDIIMMMTGVTFEQRYPKLTQRLGHEVLRVENLTSAHILKNVSFSLQKGEILGVTGLVGSGRTYLANCLFGSITPDSGTIFVDGNAVKFKHTSDAMLAGIIMLPENRAEDSIFEKFNTVFNVTVSSLTRFVDGITIDSSILEKTAKSYIERFNVMPQGVNDSLSTYSGGNQQKLIIAKCVMSRSKIFIFDEPTRGIDVATRIDIYNCMNDLISKGCSIILISSEIEEVIGMSDRIIVLSEGRIAAEMPRASATKANILSAASGNY